MHKKAEDFRLRLETNYEKTLYYEPKRIINTNCWLIL